MLSDNALLALSMLVHRLRLRGHEQVAEEIEHFVMEYSENNKAEKNKKP